MEMTWQFIAILGGFQVVLAGLVGFLGKIWINRISNDQKSASEREHGERKQQFERHLEMLKHEMQKDRAIGEAARDRVMTYLEQAMTNYSALLVLVRLANRHYWLFKQELVELERSFLSPYHNLSIYLTFLQKLEALPATNADEAHRALYHLRDAWDDVIEHLAAFKEDSKDDDDAHARHTWERLAEAARQLHKRSNSLEDNMEKVPSLTRIPR